MIVPGCPAGAPKWIEQFGLGLCVVETARRAYRITQPNLQYFSGRRESQVGLIYDRDGYASCAFTGRKADDLFSRKTRQYTQQETECEKVFVSSLHPCCVAPLVTNPNG